MKVNKKVTIVMLSSLLAGLSVTNVAAQSYLNTDPNPWSYNIYKPFMKFSEVFGESITINKWGPGGPERYIEDPTLIKALVTKGGGNNALARDSVKALLDSIVPTAEETVCEELMNLQMPFASVTSTEMVASEGLLPEYCNVLGTIDNNITFEVKLPTDWNEKFYMGGGGGMVGGIQSQGWEDALIRGYATAGTDTGHQTTNNLTAAWALNNDEAYENFGHRAVHMTAVTAKIVIRAYYDSDISKSYFSGCSTGGRMAMMESQRYPEDFDGIIVGAPANDYRPDNLVWIQQALYPDPPPAGANLSDPSTWNPTLPLEKLALVESTVIEACDGDDGLVDGLVGNPSTCNFDPATDFPMCESDIDPGDDSCLTSIEVEALKRIYNGPIASTESDADGFAFGGCEDQTTWKDWMVLNTTWAPQYYSVPNLGYSFAQEELRYFVYDDPEYDFRNFDLNDLNHLADLDSQTSVASAVDTDLSEFRNRGGKMIMYHGWCDPILSPYTTIKYFQGVADNQENYNGQSGEIQDFLRLFLAPGMLHCSGGPGPNGVDYLSALEAWVEEDVAPDALIATGGKVEDRTRPLCPHPQVAVWDGIGNTNDAASFNCQ